MQNLLEKTFGFNLRLLKALKLYPCENKAQTILVYFFMMLHIPVFGILYVLLEDDVDMEWVGNSGVVVAEMVCYFFKLLPFITNEEKITKCIQFPERIKYIKHSESQEKLLEEWVKSSKRNTVVFLTYYVGSFTMWAVSPIFSEKHKLPVDVWLPFDAAGATLYSAYFYLLMGVLYPAAASGAIEPLVAGLLSLASCQFKILKDNLQFLEEYCKDNRFSKRIEECIKHHNAILQFTKELEECFSLVIFSQLVGSLFVICFACIHLSMMEERTWYFFSGLSFILGLISQIYFYCFYGTTIFEESNSLTNAIYMGNWYDYSISVRKTLIVMMESSQKPVTITAGKIMNVSLDTFATVIKKSYSLMAVLKNQK